MVDDAKRLVKVRVDASGTRLIGHIELFAHENRISDRLNDQDAFFLLNVPETVERGPQCMAVFKDAVSYVEAIEEPEPLHQVRQSGAFQWVSVELIQPKCRLAGELFVPTGAKITHGLNDARRFVNLKNVTFDSSAEQYGYLALGKSQCRLCAVLSVDRRVA